MSYVGPPPPGGSLCVFTGGNVILFIIAGAGPGATGPATAGSGSTVTVNTGYGFITPPLT